MSIFLQNPLTIILLCIITYKIGLFIYHKTKISILNPLFIAIFLIILFLKIFGISLETFDNGGKFINMLLCPATIMLAVPMYKQRTLIKKNLLPIAVGTILGSLISMTSIYYICNWMGIDDLVTKSLIPKSTTTPIAIEISNTLGGIPSLTVAAVIITGILGSVLFPLIIKIFKMENSIASGIAIGTASHALGSAKAVEIGEIEAAMSGIAVGVAGIASVIMVLLL